MFSIHLLVEMCIGDSEAKLHAFMRRMSTDFIEFRNVNIVWRLSSRPDWVVEVSVKRFASPAIVLETYPYHNRIICVISFVSSITQRRACYDRSTARGSVCKNGSRQ